MGQSFEGSDKVLFVNKSVAQPWECDVMGHMTTRFYVAKFDDASYHLLHQVFGWSISDRESCGLGWADVRHVIEYKAEVSAGELLEIRARLKKIGKKSFTALYEMIDCSSGEVAATLEAVCVHFDLNARRAIAIPGAMRARAGKFLED
ncbi:MAG: thioesterase family protein [Xanthomonadales bacterium]|nr:thioesterase family protein [Xanthomonadales bacterium]